MHKQNNVLLVAAPFYKTFWINCKIYPIVDPDTEKMNYLREWDKHRREYKEK